MENKSNYADWSQTSINERIKYIVDTFFKGNTTQMAKSVFVSQSTLRDIVGERNSAPSFETMKQIVESAPLLPFLSSYYARHTWATLAAELDIPEKTIQMALEHGKKSVTDRYINFNMKKVDEANRKVIDYLFEEEKPGS